MRFLQLNNRMSNSSIHDKDSIKWELPTLQLTYDERIALSSLVIDFKEKPPSKTPIIVMTNLIDKNSFNPDGIIYASPARSRDISYTSHALESWKTDSTRPRQVIFTFPGINVDTISFISITLAIL